MLDILYSTRPSWLILDPKKVGDLTYRNSGHLSCIAVQHVLAPKVYAEAYTISLRCQKLDRKVPCKREKTSQQSILKLDLLTFVLGC